MLATATPDQTFPASATKVQAMLGIDDCVAFDVAAVCSGFLYALQVADSMIRAGARQARAGDRRRDVQPHPRLGGPRHLRAVRRRRRRGRARGAGERRRDGRGILATRLHADGRHNDLLYVDGGPSTTGTVGKLRMKGREVFRHAVVNLAAVMSEALAAAGLTSATSTGSCRTRPMPASSTRPRASSACRPSKVVVTVDQHANTSAASVPLALDTAVRDGRIKRGDLIVLEAMGGGFTWGAAVVRF